MTEFTVGTVFYALAIGLLVGVVGVAGFNSQQSANSEALKALRQRMGPLCTIALFSIGALPTMAMWLGGSLRSAPTTLDTLVLIVLIGLGVIASFTLLGNLLGMLGERLSSGSTK